MVCPSCNRINSGQHCYVHNILTCLGCLYDSPSGFCDAPSFIERSKKFNAEKKAEMDKLLDLVKSGGDTWVPQ